MVVTIYQTGCCCLFVCSLVLSTENGGNYLSDWLLLFVCLFSGVNNNDDKKIIRTFHSNRMQKENLKYFPQ